MLIQLVFICWLIALLFFVLTLICYDVGLRVISNLLVLIATDALLIGGGLLVLFVVFVWLKACCAQIGRYLSAPAQARRQVLFNLLRQDTVLRLQAGRLQQQRYWAERSRKRILTTNDQVQLKALQMAITADLRQRRSRLPKSLYHDYQQQISLAVRQQSLESLLNLHQQILAH